MPGPWPRAPPPAKGSRQQTKPNNTQKTSLGPGEKPHRLVIKIDDFQYLFGLTWGGGARSKCNTTQERQGKGTPGTNRRGHAIGNDVHWALFDKFASPLRS